MYKKINKLVAKLLLANMLFSMLATPVMYAQETISTEGVAQETVTEPAIETVSKSETKGSDKKEDASPSVVDDKKSDAPQLDLDNSWKSKITDPEILKKIKDKEDELDKELDNKAKTELLDSVNT